jgi:predicted regulator of Ras-like GTPase activity (Roadblock/LC7/MglB family)
MMSKGILRMTAAALLAAAVGLVSASPVRVADCLAKWLPDALVNAQGKPVRRNALAGKVVGLYFAAAENPSCQAFTPVLAEFRNRHADTFAVVLVSRDGTAKAMQEHLRQDADWLAVPYASPRREALVKQLEIQGVPTLVVISAKGRVVDVNGCATVMAGGEELPAAWKKAHSVDVFFDE